MVFKYIYINEDWNFKVKFMNLYVLYKEEYEKVNIFKFLYIDKEMEFEIFGRKILYVR